MSDYGYHDLTVEMLTEPIFSSKHPLGISFAERLDQKLEPVGECLIYQGHGTPTGHGQMSLRYDEIFVHRAAWVLAHGPIPDGMEVLHACDNNACCQPKHLFLGTKKDRGRWMTERGHNYATRFPELASERVSGDKNPSRLHPERLRRGDKNPSRLYPEKLKRGSASHYAKVNEDAVRTIRARCARGELQRDVAKDFGITQGAVSWIVQRKTWAHVQDAA